MRYSRPGKSFFIGNRAKLTQMVERDSLTVICANRIVYYNRDASYNFIQNSDFYYFTGIDQEDCILLLYPNARDEAEKEILFIKKTDEHTTTWEGDKLDKNQAANISGVKTICWLEEFDFWFNVLSSQNNEVYLGYPGVGSQADSISTKYSELMKNFPLISFRDMRPFSEKCRLIKGQEEINMIRKAIEITKEGILELMNKPMEGLKEYHLEATLTAAYLSSGSRRNAFHTIVAGGNNATILHYIRNTELLKKNEMVLIDTGAEYGNYNADITRVLPVSGKFSDRGKEVYEAVLRVLKESMELVKPGITLKTLNGEIAKLVATELNRLNLIKSTKTKEYRKYYMHSGSHFLGLDVHDVGSKDTVLQDGMVLTIEPGIYINEEGIGIRLENDVLVTDRGMENLSADIPIEIKEIEKLMS